jgi:hypothetical protein
MTLLAASLHGPPATRAVLRRGSKPLVGFPSNRNTLRVQQRADRLVCDVAPGTRAFLLIFAVAFGPVLTLLLVVAPRGFNSHIPLFIELALWAAAGGMWLLLLHTLVSKPRLEVLQSTGDILWFKRGRTPLLTLGAARVTGLSLEEEVYRSSRYQVTPNYVLLVHTRDGEAIRLCITPDLGRIETFGRQVATLTRTQFATQTNEPQGLQVTP